MTSSPPRHAALRREPRPSGLPRRTTRLFAVAAALAAFSLAVISAVAPPAPAKAHEQALFAPSGRTQTVAVPGNVTVVAISRGRYTATSAIEALAATGTNYDWAKLVLSSGGWPTSEANVTVLVRWMRQENGPNDWWNRDNPLNNGWGSGGGGGTGTYANLVVAAQMAAQALHGNPGYGPIISALAASAPASVTAQAIWASPWSTSHYANGTHWSQAPVPMVRAPASAW